MLGLPPPSLFSLPVAELSLHFFVPNTSPELARSRLCVSARGRVSDDLTDGPHLQIHPLFNCGTFGHVQEITGEKNSVLSALRDQIPSVKTETWSRCVGKLLSNLERVIILLFTANHFSVLCLFATFY